MSKRPFISLGIVDLEKRFDQERNDIDFLETLLGELQHRKTNRAMELKQRVVQARGVSNKLKTSKVVIGQQLPQSKTPLQPSSTSAEIVPPKPVPEIKVPPLPDFPRANTDAAGLAEPERVLLSWTALEVLSPQSYKKPEDLAGGSKYKIAELDNTSLPWENGGERSKKNNRLYYQIVLGSIDMPPAIEGLLKVYTDTRNERPQARGQSIIATILVDQKGCPLEDEGYGISSFAWGLPIALSGDLKALSQWSVIEGCLQEAIETRLRRSGDNGALTRADIENIYEWLIEHLNIPKAMCIAPTFAIRTYQYFKNDGPPESLLLNSFYLEDLSTARAAFNSGDAPENLRRYIGDIKPENRKELLYNQTALTGTLDPSKMPLGSWPGNGRYPLVTLQQTAVNLTASELKNGGILAVNGPPGTGKTTLLRDVVAHVVTERARIMATYHDPEDAFTNSNERVKRGQAFLWMYKLDECLRGFEMVVASSNNKAVENVSAELPGVDSVAEDAFSDGYFKTISDALLEQDTWGLVAAVLGNSKNRWKFSQKFWWDEDTGLTHYLKHCAGSRPMVHYKDDEGASQERPPYIVTRENPPSDKSEANSRWLKAKAHFKKVEKQVTDNMALMIQVAKVCSNVAVLKSNLLHLQSQLELESDKLAGLHKIRVEIGDKVTDLKSVLSGIQADYERVCSARPGLLSRLFSRQKYKDWEPIQAAVKQDLSVANNHLEGAAAQQKEIEKATDNAQLLVASLQQSIIDKKASFDKYTAELDVFQKTHNGQFIDDDFFEKNYVDRQVAAPWLDNAMARVRQDLFEASLALHRAFIDAAAKPIRHNIGLLLDSYGAKSLGTVKRDVLIPQLWSTLFLVVPVISTTFASVGRMFGRLGSESLGWLLIDEAGQALPQAAVGAIMRCKRAVVVGDPMQIEPVVMLPDHLTDAICREFNVDETVYNAPAGSAQTLSDSATAYFASFETKFGSREVGVPLLVHRRCEEPMFGISNSVAYEGLMVQAKAAKNSPIKDVLGPSRWFHVEGSGQDKWCASEGDVVIKILTKLKRSGVVPDIYIVTPFVVVQDRMRQLIRQSGILENWVEEPARWPYERIGTVHTVQGREAEAVIFVLGAPDAKQTGARNWAGGRPNLLNVAVSRAKETLYVVGNKTLWEKAGVFSNLAQRLKSD